MLPLQLLRVRIFNKGKNISPIFCRPAKGSSYELELAANMIKKFEESFRKRETKGSLGESISSLEASYNDYKLVRGLYALLERRSTFISGDGQKPTTIVDDSAGIVDLDSFQIRKHLFEESSARGYPLTDHERNEIFNSVSSKMRVSRDIIVREMWADLEENMILHQFVTLEPEKLIAWYNLSLMQTLLFNCTNLEFNIQGGYNWKRVLRAVKRLGLMYNLHYRQKEGPRGSQSEPQGQKIRQDIHNPANRNSLHTVNEYDNNNLLCSIDGPLSIFKLTDRYGTSIAKLLPSIIVTGNWSLKASIVRKTATMGKKIYEFISTSAESTSLPSENDLIVYDNDNIKNTASERLSYSASPSADSFDSNVEQKFALKFKQFSNGWNLIREPNPLIVSNGKGFIPDFVFEKYGIRIYLEIIGFWTNDYLVRKIQKIADIISLSSSVSSSYDSSGSKPNQSVNTKNFFVAVNMDCYVSGSSLKSEKVLTTLRLSDYIEKGQLIKFKNDNVPIKPILDHLRSIDIKMIGKLAKINRTHLVKELDRLTVYDSIDRSNSSGIISLAEIAEKYDVPVESILQIVKDSGDINASGYKDRYLVEDNYLIPLAKITEIKPHLRNDIRYIDACRILADYHIPETCYNFILHKIGYDVIWHSMDANGATIRVLGT
jgi:predicted nuclease of restriction endonuclease-like RecB superfamily